MRCIKCINGFDGFIGFYTCSEEIYLKTENFIPCDERIY